MSALLRDLQVGSRSLRKHAGLSLVAVTALTLGIGLTTTMFSIVYGALIKGLPFKDGDRIVMLHQGGIILDISGAERASVTLDNLLDQFRRKEGTELADDQLLLG